MYCTPQVTLPVTPVIKQIPGSGSGFFGMVCTYAESATFYIQLWWQGNSNSPPTFSTTPTMTIPVTSVGVITSSLTEPIIMQGPIWWAATAAAVPSTTAITGGEVLTFFLG